MLKTKKKELLKKWLEIGNNNPFIRQAWDPEFDENSFNECVTLTELLNKLDHGNWSLGTAFYHKYKGDYYCFINQVNAGSEWLCLKNDFHFESITYAPKGYDIGMNREEFKEWFKAVKTATDEELKNLNYK